MAIDLQTPEQSAAADRSPVRVFAMRDIDVDNSQNANGLGFNRLFAFFSAKKGDHLAPFFADEMLELRETISVN